MCEIKLFVQSYHRHSSICTHLPIVITPGENKAATKLSFHRLHFVGLFSLAGFLFS